MEAGTRVVWEHLFDWGWQSMYGTVRGMYNATDVKVEMDGSGHEVAVKLDQLRVVGAPKPIFYAADDDRRWF